MCTNICQDCAKTFCIYCLYSVIINRWTKCYYCHPQLTPSQKAAGLGFEPRQSAYITRGIHRTLMPPLWKYLPDWRCVSLLPPEQHSPGDFL